MTRRTAEEFAQLFTQPPRTAEEFAQLISQIFGELFAELPDKEKIRYNEQVVGPNIHEEIWGAVAAATGVIWKSPFLALGGCKMTETRTLQFESGRALQLLYANDLKLLKTLEDSLGVKVTTREGWVKLEGEPEKIDQAEHNENRRGLPKLACQRAVADFTGVDLVNLTLVHEDNLVDVVRCHGLWVPLPQYYMSG